MTVTGYKNESINHVFLPSLFLSAFRSRTTDAFERLDRMRVLPVEFNFTSAIYHFFYQVLHSHSRDKKCVARTLEEMADAV